MFYQLLARVGFNRVLRSSLASSDSDKLGDEFKLPRMASLVIVIAYNIMLQVRILRRIGMYIAP